MTPERARVEYAAWKRTWKRHGIQCVMRHRKVYMWCQGRYGPPSAATEVLLVKHAAHHNLCLMREAADLMLSKPSRPVDGGPNHAPLSDPQAQQRWPTLWLHLTQTSYPDGDKREPSTLLLFLQDGSLKAMCRDKDGDRCLWAAARSLVGVLDAIDGALADPEADWRPDRKAPGQSAPRGKRSA